MSDTIDRLKTILRLRRRDLDRYEREVAEARRQMVAAEVEASEAAHACTRALTACDRAMAQQARQPCDPLVQLHCRASAAKAEAARQLRMQARAALDDARMLVEGVKREWVRAQARHDAIVGELDRAMRAWKRQMSRRADDEIRANPQVSA